MPKEQDAVATLRFDKVREKLGARQLRRIHAVDRHEFFSDVETARERALRIDVAHDVTAAHELEAKAEPPGRGDDAVPELDADERAAVPELRAGGGGLTAIKRAARTDTSRGRARAALIAAARARGARRT